LKARIVLEQLSARIFPERNPRNNR